LAFCRNRGSGKVRICKTAMLPLKMRLDFYSTLIIPLLAGENHLRYSRLIRVGIQERQLTLVGDEM